MEGKLELLPVWGEVFCRSDRFPLFSREQCDILVDLGVLSGEAPENTRDIAILEQISASKLSRALESQTLRKRCHDS